MLLTVEKGIRSRLYHFIHRYAKDNNKYMKVYDKNKESSYLKYWYVNNLYCWAMQQNLFGNRLKRVEYLSQFIEES